MGSIHESVIFHKNEVFRLFEAVELTNADLVLHGVTEPVVEAYTFFPDMDKF